MSRIVVLGGSVAGLLAGMQLARRGHEVVVLERDVLGAVAPHPDASPDPRPGTPHAVQGHALLARAAVDIRQTLPTVYSALVDAGAGELDLVAEMPAAIADRSPRSGDDELVMLTSRRHTFDRVLVEAAASTANLDVRFGVTADGLQLERDDGLAVAGVRVGRETIGADLVIDASGRRTPVPRWLAGEGVRLPLEAWDCGLVYFTRHYRVRRGVTRPPLNRIFAAGGFLPSLAIAWFPGDNDTAMLAEIVLAEDALLKTVRRTQNFVAVAEAVPTIAPWLGCSDPTTDVFGMGALKNTLRRSIVDGRALVLGLHFVGDAACTTNPTLGRGISFATAHARRLAQIIDEEPDDPHAQALLLDEFVGGEIEPRFRENALFDRARVTAMRADLAGEQPPPPAAPTEDGLRPEELLMAGLQDPDLYREHMRYSQLLAPSTMLADEGLVARVREVVPATASPPPPAGPSRGELEQLLRG